MRWRTSRVRVLAVTGAACVVAWSAGATRPALAAGHVFAFALLGCSVRVRRTARALPAPQRIIVAGLVAALLVGQLVRDSERTFPFPFWDMYTKAPAVDATVASVRVEGVRRDGSTLPVEPWDLFGIHEGRAGIRLFLQADALARAGLEPGVRSAVERIVAQRLEWILDAHARAHPDAESLAALRLRVAEQPVRGARVVDREAHRVVAEVRREPAP